jgi:Ca-activated chloride channel family protein
MRFGEPHWLWLLALLPLLAVGLTLALRRRGRALRAWCDDGLLVRMVPDRAPRVPWLRAGLVVLAAAFLVLAAARPQVGSRVLAVERKGIDLMVALDLSESMRAEDLRPDRLTRAKQGVESLLDRLRGDRVGLVGFAGDAFVQCPLTLDYAAARMFLRLMTPEMIPVPGTDLGAAIRSAVKSFDPKERKYKALVLVTDGEDHGRDLEAAVREAKEQGVRVFAVGIGSEKGEPIPQRSAAGEVRDYKRARDGDVVMTRLDAATLRKICDDTGGRYFDGNAGGLALDRLYGEISGMEQKEQKGGIAVQYDDRYGYFAAAAFLLLAVESMLAERRRAGNGRRRSRTARRERAGLGLLVALFASSLLLASGAPAVGAATGDPGGRAYRKGDYAAARDAYAAYAREHPDDPRGEYNLGTALNRAGEMPPAQESFLRAVRSSDPKLRAAALYNLGNTRVKAGDLPGAAEAYEMALRQRPDDRDAKYNLELVRALMQQQPPDSSGQKQQQQKKKNDGRQDQKNQEKQQNQQGKQDQQDQKDQKDQQSQEDQKNQQNQQQQQQDQQDKKQDQQQQPDQQQAQEGQQGADSTEAPSQADMQPLKITPEQARRILDGLAQQEMTLQQERLRARSRPLKVEKDW